MSMCIPQCSWPCKIFKCSFVVSFQGSPFSKYLDPIWHKASGSFASILFINRSLHSSCVLGKIFLQNGHLCIKFPSNSRFLLASLQPLQIRLLQHVYRVDFSDSIGKGKQQIGQSPTSLSSGCLNNNSSCNSAARFLHSRLCFGRWSFWHLTLQYLTRWQAEQSFNVMSLPPVVPQDAQHCIISSASFALIFSSRRWPYIIASRQHSCLSNCVCAGRSLQ